MLRIWSKLLMSVSTAKKFRRILVKLSGEGLMGSHSFGFDSSILLRLATEVKVVRENGIEVSLVIGGGNIFRSCNAEINIDRVQADYIGMLATVINALAFSGALVQINCPVQVMSSIPIPTVCEPFIRSHALNYLSSGHVVIFAAGTGSPFFTTDTAAVLRAIEMSCDAILKVTQVDGVYSVDPQLDQSARRYKRLTYTDVLARGLRIMDTTAIALAQENNLPIMIFTIHTTNSLADVLAGRGLFTIISSEDEL